jgi:NADPH-dependent curcumin reductase CurA
MSAHPPRNRRIVLAARPRGLPAPGDFRLEETAVPEPGVGQVLLRTRYLSLDPYMRNLMEEIGPVYAPSVALGDTVVVAAATGAVGSMVGQLAKLRGARVVGIAGGPDKCRHAVEQLGFDACVDRHAPGLPARLATACPDGIDVYFENVGGEVFDAVLPLLNVGARVPVCGVIAHYNDQAPPPGPDRLPQALTTVLQKRIRMQGFIILDHYGERFEAYLREMEAWVASGRIRLHEEIVDGLENAPAAFIGLLQGRNLGKLVVRVAGD